MAATAVTEAAGAMEETVATASFWAQLARTAATEVTAVTAEGTEQAEQAVMPFREIL